MKSKTISIIAIVLVVAAIACHWFASRMPFLVIPMVLLYATAIGLVFVGLGRTTKEGELNLRKKLWLTVVIIFCMSFLLPVVYGFIEKLLVIKISDWVYDLTIIILYLISAISAIGLFIWGLISPEEKTS